MLLRNMFKLLPGEVLLQNALHDVPITAGVSHRLGSSWGKFMDPNEKIHPNTRKKNSKHYNPLFRTERGQKFIKVHLPNFDERIDELTPPEIRMKLKARGLHPYRSWDEKPFHIASTPTIFEPYIPPESDGKLSIVSKEGAKQKFELMTKKGKSYMAVRKIQRFDEDFDLKDFVEEGQQIYIKAVKALADKDDDRLYELVTERAFPLLTHETKNKTFRWQFIENIEAPRAMHARVTDVLTKENFFAQVTVRMHTKQTLAIYDRFGRLMHGSEVVAKDLLEYVVFEKHISNMDGVWRVQGKIVPSWAESAIPSLRTYRVKPVEEEDDSDSEEQDSVSATAPPTPPPTEGDAPRPAFN